ncbi:HD-GYP domain-containing protein [Lucifera butyrica]|nr:HD-GYP domain-containing protein [Lucifera butyrica]
MKQQTELSIIEQIDMDTIEMFCRQIYYCDPYTAMHAEHVAELMAGLASLIFRSSDEISLAYMVGLLHDVGKIKTPEHILIKPGRLTEEEYAVMKRHAADGADMLAEIEGIEAIVPVMRHHHERFDGRGYPDGLKETEIPFFSRMLSICDTFDAMTTHRCYREPVSLRECLREIKRCSGSQFDPAICKVFIEFIEERFGFTLEEAQG